MLTRLTILLSDDERFALQKLGEQEMRGMKDQVRILLRTELERRGFLENASVCSAKSANSNDD